MRDFNVMFNSQARASLSSRSLVSNQSEVIEITEKRIVLFVHTGKFLVGEYLLETGSVLDIEENDGTSLSCICMQTGTILCANMLMC